MLGCMKPLQAIRSPVILDQEWANYSPHAKSGRLLIYVNIVLLEHRHIHFYALSVATFVLVAELSSGDGVYMACKG